MSDINIVIKDSLSDNEKEFIEKELATLSDKIKYDLISYDDRDHIEFDLKGGLEVVNKSDDGRRVIAGYASVAVVDDDNQYIPPKVLEDGLRTLMADESYANLMVVHHNIQIGKLLSEYKDLQTKVDDKGLFIVAEIRKDLETANSIWSKILNGIMKGFSIGGEIIEKHNHCDEDRCYEMIDKINLFEVSVCSNPINSPSGFEIVAKSNVSEKCEYKDDDNMSENKEELDTNDCKDCDPKDVVEEKVEKTEETEVVEEKVEEPVEETEKADPMEAIMSQMEDLFNKFSSSIVDQFDTIMKSINEPEPVETETEEKSEDEVTEEKVEETEKSEDKEFEYAIKARDDAIKGYEEKIGELEKTIKDLSAKVENLENVEETPKTTHEVEEEIIKDSGIIIKHGRVYKA